MPAPCDPLTCFDVMAWLVKAECPCLSTRKIDWDAIAKEQSSLDAWLDEWVHGTANHAEYVERFGDARWDALRPEPALSGEVDYGRYA